MEVRWDTPRTSFYSAPYTSVEWGLIRPDKSDKILGIESEYEFNLRCHGLCSCLADMKVVTVRLSLNFV
jgi:hypothetical protein